MPERDAYIYIEEGEEDPARQGGGAKRMPRATKDGSLFVAPWLMGHLLDGRLFSVNVGTVTAPVTAAGTVAATTPDLHLQIPDKTRIIPVSLTVSIDALVDDQSLEIVAAISNGLDTTPTGGTGQTILNRNLTHARASNCKAESDVSAITSMVTGRRYLEFMRDGAHYGATPVAAQSEEGQPTTFKWSAAEDAPVLADGPAELALMIGKGGFAYFATLTWIELPS